LKAEYQQHVASIEAQIASASGSAKESINAQGAEVWGKIQEIRAEYQDQVSLIEAQIAAANTFCKTTLEGEKHALQQNYQNLQEQLKSALDKASDLI